MKITYQKGMLNFEKTENKTKGENAYVEITPKTIVKIIKRLTELTKQRQITWQTKGYSSFTEFITKINGAEMRLNIFFKKGSTLVDSYKIDEPFNLSDTQEVCELGKVLINLFGSQSKKYQEIKALKKFLEI